MAAAAEPYRETRGITRAAGTLLQGATEPSSESFLLFICSPATAGLRLTGQEDEGVWIAQGLPQAGSMSS